jgi:signal transduction histidine kinase
LGTIYVEKDSDEIKEVVAETYNEIYDKVNSYIQYLSDTVDDFRKAVIFNREEERKYFNIYKFFKDIEDFVSISLAREKIKLINTVNLEFVEVKGIENDLKQVVLNIIHNAQDMFRERNIQPRTIKIDHFFTEKALNITIIDNAGGISKDVISQIFDAYFTTRHETQGTGLGLYMSKELVEKSFHGNIYAKNSLECSDCNLMCINRDEKGACFTIEIPHFREI